MHQETVTRQVARLTRAKVKVPQKSEAELRTPSNMTPLGSAATTPTGTPVVTPRTTPRGNAAPAGGLTPVGTTPLSPKKGKGNAKRVKRELSPEKGVDAPQGRDVHTPVVCIAPGPRVHAVVHAACALACTAHTHALYTRDEHWRATPYTRPMHVDVYQCAR
eukprot:TRINITY_DN6170_c0_g2_i1.p3 TRINITY_DN6170_c0_g2~~TRINITY_DN6170_c0_g2_i1.p3  ORF type:complete len:162 (-),score=13.64 TRINITY_DN6170_c0_g2_i1:151-636(-)